MVVRRVFDAASNAVISGLEQSLKRSHKITCC